MGDIKLNHDLRSVNSGTIYLPPNATVGNLHTPNLHLATVAQLFDLGTKYVCMSTTTRCSSISGLILAVSCIVITELQLTVRLLLPVLRSLKMLSLVLPSSI